jgi:serine/threonine-protein kinase
MGSVWVADHLSLKTQVVVKFMSAELAANLDAIARFKREAEAAARVKSPHVVQVFDFGVNDGLPYIVMELLEGRDLARYMEQVGVLAPSEVVEIVGQVAKALGKAHEAGIVHRDIKPENIFLCGAEGSEVFVKLLDFGIAKAEAQKLGTGTRTGQVVGTPYYMSPEQIIGSKTLDLRADLWSLAVVVFEALVGRRPFEGETVGALTLSIHGPTPSPTALNPSLPPAIDAWFRRACAKDPNERFGSARELAQALAEALVGSAGPARGLSLRPAFPAQTGPRLYDTQAATELGASMAAPAATASERKRGAGKWALVGAAGLIVAVASAITTVKLAQRNHGGRASAGATGTTTAARAATAAATATTTATATAATTATATATATTTTTATTGAASPTPPLNSATSTGRSGVPPPKRSTAPADAKKPQDPSGASPPAPPKPTSNEVPVLW